MLIGPRVTLRAFTREDLPLVWKYRTDVEVELAGGGDPPLPILFHQIEKEFDNRSFIFDGSFCIEIDGECKGYAGLFNYNELARNCELGITIGDPSYWSKGYGRECIQLLLVYGFQMRNMQRIWLHTNSNNVRGLGCYKACGFIEEGRLRQHVWNNGDYVDAVYMGILRDDWTTSRKSTE